MVLVLGAHFKGADFRGISTSHQERGLQQVKTRENNSMSEGRGRGADLRRSQQARRRHHAGLRKLFRAHHG